MRHRFRLGAIGLVLGFVACTHLTAEDEARLGLLEKQYGARFTFSASDIYLSVTARTAEAAAWDEWIDVYRAFWFTGGRPRLSSLIYMNVYDSGGRWQGQFAWDPLDRKITFEQKREHY